MLITGTTSPHDWPYICFDPDLNAIDWRPAGLSSDGTPMFEMVLLRRADVAAYQSIFAVFPDRTEFSLGDLWTRHPSRPQTWRYAARLDDLIRYAHGTKFNPLAAQHRIAAHAYVREALLAGDGHEQTVMLIELTAEALALVERGMEQSVRDEIWEDVKEMNRDLTSVAQLSKSHMVFAKREKPFARASKGTVMRYHTLKAYEQELEACWAEFGDTEVEMLGRVGGGETV